MSFLRKEILTWQFCGHRFNGARTSWKILNAYCSRRLPEIRVVGAIIEWGTAVVERHACNVFFVNVLSTWPWMNCLVKDEVTDKIYEEGTSYSWGWNWCVVRQHSYACTELAQVYRSVQCIWTLVINEPMKLHVNWKSNCREEVIVYSVPVLKRCLCSALLCCSYRCYDVGDKSSSDLSFQEMHWSGFSEDYSISCW